jgi:hypothetical protein
MTAKKAFFCIYVLFVSCKNNETQSSIDPTWIKNKLPNGWTIYTPTKFEVKNLKGIDSQPGYISSFEDSILLNYDTGADIFPKKNDCDFSKEVADAKFRIMNQDEEYNNGTTTIYNLRIDTINEKVAIIKTPKIKGNGAVSVEIKDCQSGAWIGVYGKDFNLEREKMIINIFKTIKFGK